MGFDLSSLKILIVDDSTHMRGLIKRVLSSFNISDITEAADGNEALLEMTQTVPDIVLTDFAMDRMNGIELTHFIRNSEKSPNPYLPIIMMTGFTEMHRVIEARDSGVTEIIAKPVSARAMFSRLVAVVDRPRPFVRVTNFFGPDRRRRQVPFKGEDRRRSSEDWATATGAIDRDVPFCDGL